MSIMLDTPDGVKFYQMGARKGALSLEIAGMRRRGQSAYSICKQVYGLTGSREVVLWQMEWMVEGAIARKHGMTEDSPEFLEIKFEAPTRPLASKAMAAFLIGLRGMWVQWQ
jgi:hypothetical protein